MAQTVFAPWDDPQAKPLIQFRNVTKRFGDFTAIENLTQDIYEREFFSLLGPSGQPKNVVINDINSDVVNIYKAIKTDLTEFQQRLDSLESQYLPLSKDDRKKFYFDTRHLHAWNYQEWSKTFEAATLYFLMKTGFNGIYQLNKNTNGRYGTPAGLLNQKDKVYDRGVLNWWHNALQNVTIKTGDWTVSYQAQSASSIIWPPLKCSWSK